MWQSCWKQVVISPRIPECPRHTSLRLLPDISEPCTHFSALTCVLLVCPGFSSASQPPPMITLRTPSPPRGTFPGPVQCPPCPHNHECSICASAAQSSNCCGDMRGECELLPLLLLLLLPVCRLHRTAFRMQGSTRQFQRRHTLRLVETPRASAISQRSQLPFHASTCSRQQPCGWRQRVPVPCAKSDGYMSSQQSCEKDCRDPRWPRPVPHRGGHVVTVGACIVLGSSRRRTATGSVRGAPVRGYRPV